MGREIRGVFECEEGPDRPLRLTDEMDLSLNPYPFCKHHRKDGAPAKSHQKVTASQNDNAHEAQALGIFSLSDAPRAGGATVTTRSG